MEVREKWTKWLLFVCLMNFLFVEIVLKTSMNQQMLVATYQLQGFCDASDSAFFSMVYLRKIVDGKAQVAFISDRSRLVLTKWVISCKELETC